MVADGGSVGWSGTVAVWLEEMDDPSGSWTWMDWLGVMLTAGVVVEMKWLLQPLSRMAVVRVGWAKVEQL